MRASYIEHIAMPNRRFSFSVRGQLDQAHLSNPSKKKLADKARVGLSSVALLDPLLWPSNGRAEASSSSLDMGCSGTLREVARTGLVCIQDSMLYVAGSSSVETEGSHT